MVLQVMIDELLLPQDPIQLEVLARFRFEVAVSLQHHVQTIVDQVANHVSLESQCLLNLDAQ